MPTEDAGAKTETGIWPNFPEWGIHPAVLVHIEKGLGNQEYFPWRTYQPARVVKLTPYALIERQVGTLESIGELDDIEQPIICLGKNRMRTATQITNMSRYHCEVLTQVGHSSPRESNWDEPRSSL